MKCLLDVSEKFLSQNLYLLTMLKLFKKLLFHLEEEIVIVLHFLRRIHHERTHQVRAVGLVADTHRTCYCAKMHVIFVTKKERPKSVHTTLVKCCLYLFSNFKNGIPPAFTLPT